jgi:hypothetical protein
MSRFALVALLALAVLPPTACAPPDENPRDLALVDDDATSAGEMYLGCDQDATLVVRVRVHGSVTATSAELLEADTQGVIATLALDRVEGVPILEDGETVYGVEDTIRYARVPRSSLCARIDGVAARATVRFSDGSVRTARSSE